MENYSNTIADILIGATSLQGAERLNVLREIKNNISNLTDEEIDNRMLVMEIVDGLVESAKKDVTNIKKMSIKDIEKEEADAELENLVSSIDDIVLDDIDLYSLIDDLDDIDFNELD